MEIDNNTSLFSLSIDPAAKSHLADTSKWTRILAISGISFIVIILLLRVLPFFFISRAFGNIFFETTDVASIAGIVMGLLLVLAIPLISLIYLLKFSSSLKKALATDDQLQLNNAFKNLKIYFRYISIITLILLVLVSITFLFQILSIVP